jgi:8-oxo-dGTP diphosphatase
VILLIRHGSAGERDEWEGDDLLRPLDKRGRRQAEELVELLARYELERILSSPAIRCVQTIEPLAQARGVDIELRDELSEERQSMDGPALVRSFQAVNAAVSCHGGLSEAVCGRSQKKAEVLALEGEEVADRVRARG